ncbi:hypothetical protein ACIBI9_05650 [Nonomuraea sp. NPDC050451]|uniref:hypothetical protein n=1 Tax=Nonomuraea sp. NPDC050451 TaxID=3364364 RepID=UPI00378FDFBB
MGHHHTPCTPGPARQLFEITALDAADERWHTIGWGIDQAQAETVAQDCVTRPVSPYRAARIRHDGRLIAEHHRLAR